MRLSGQFQACLFYFLRKDFKRSKTHHKQKPTNKQQANTKQQWQQFFVCTVTSKRVKIVCLHLGSFFTLKIFL